MNNEYEFAKYLKDIENEITNLKTAHQRPLGALSFFEQNFDFTVNLSYSVGVYIATFNVIVKIATPSVKPPIVQTGWDIPAGFYSVDFLDFNVDSNYETWTYKLQLLSPTTTTANFKVKALSSQPIESITWSLV